MNPTKQNRDTKLEARLLRGLRSGSAMDFSYRNLARALTRNERAVRRSLRQLYAVDAVKCEIVKGVAYWSAA